MEKNSNISVWSKALAWLKVRLSEPNTWSWIVGAAAYFGYVLDPSMVEYIAGVAISVITLIQVAKKEPVTAVKEINKQPEISTTSTEVCETPQVTEK